MNSYFLNKKSTTVWYNKLFFFFFKFKMEHKNRKDDQTISSLKIHLLLLADVQYSSHTIWITVERIYKSPQHQIGVDMPEVKNHSITHGIFNYNGESSKRDFILEEVICSLK